MIILLSGGGLGGLLILINSIFITKLRINLRKGGIGTKKLILLLIIITPILFISGCSQKINQAELKAQEFIEALAEQDYKTAMELADGRVLFTLKGREGQKNQNTAAINKIKLTAIAQSEDWAIINAKIETETKQNVTDLTWYKLELRKTGQQKSDQWKIYKAELTGPQLTGKSKNPVQTDTNDAKDTFDKYTNAVIRTDWEKASSYLVGQAKRSQEIGIDILDKSPVLKKIKGLEMTSLWQNENILVCEANYKADDRNVKVVVTFAQLSDGQWKIAGIDPA